MEITTKINDERADERAAVEREAHGQNTSNKRNLRREKEEEEEERAAVRGRD